MSRSQTRRYRLVGALTTTLLVAAVVGATAGARGSTTVARSEPANPTIVLVHGAWADSSSWSKEAEAFVRAPTFAAGITYIPAVGEGDRARATQRGEWAYEACARSSAAV